MSAKEELSGVARYVESQEQARIEAKNAEVTPTGVAKYLATVAESKPVATGVTKYLRNREEVQVSSVSRYVINKWLRDQDKEAPVILEETGVEKYIASIPTLMTSSVAKYVAKQEVLARQARQAS
jgi:hypothetical protein